MTSKKKIVKSPKKTPTHPYMVVVTYIASHHATEAEARAALKKLKPQPLALGVVVEK